MWSTLFAISIAQGLFLATTLPGVGYSAYFKDPDNNIFGLWKEDPDAKIAQ